MKIKTVILFLPGLFAAFLPGVGGSGLSAQEKGDYTPEIHGTVRAKYEYQPRIRSGRFEVRNARVSVGGRVSPAVAYKAEIDLSDEGSIKMLDAYTRLTPVRSLEFTIGQMRVPFTIDAHRSPHQQFFANRSFIAKQVGSVRDVGATLGCRFDIGFPVVVEGGLFNGSGLTDQKDFWTRSVNYSVKTQLMAPGGFCLSLSMQKIRPGEVDIHMYDAGFYWHGRGWHIEAEYLCKRYARSAFRTVNAFDGFVCRDLPLRRVFRKISLLARFDCMGDHSDGIGSGGTLLPTDAGRSRLTGGVTLSLAGPFVSDIRINCEKYFYRPDAEVKISERDKVVVEFVTRF